MPTSLHFVRRFMPVLLFVTFCLISLGGAVRAMNAGLACPDWPLCFGKVVPHFDIQIFYEWIHRKIAAGVGLTTITFAILIYRSKAATTRVRISMGVALALLACQVILGGLTVLKLLHFGVVTAHLAFGMAFFGTLLWTGFLLKQDLAKSSSPVEQKTSAMPLGFLLIVFFSTVLVYGQILLGGLVSSNYAGLACSTEFPLCNGEWVPTLSGVVGLQVLHRFGAYAVVLTILSLYQVIRKNKKADWSTPQLQSLSKGLVMATFTQIGLGIMNVKYGIPPVVTVLHLAVATGILAMLLRVLFLGYVQVAEPESETLSAATPQRA